MKIYHTELACGVAVLPNLVFATREEARVYCDRFLAATKPGGPDTRDAFPWQEDEIGDRGNAETRNYGAEFPNHFATIVEDDAADGSWFPTLGQDPA